jgi:hypothetical protein
MIVNCDRNMFIVQAIGHTFKHYSNLKRYAITNTSVYIVQSISD